MECGGWGWNWNSQSACLSVAQHLMTHNSRENFESNNSSNLWKLYSMFSLKALEMTIPMVCHTYIYHEWKRTFWGKNGPKTDRFWRKVRFADFRRQNGPKYQLCSRLQINHRHFAIFFLLITLINTGTNQQFEMVSPESSIKLMPLVLQSSFLHYLPSIGSDCNF